MSNLEQITFSPYIIIISLHLRRIFSYFWTVDHACMLENVANHFYYFLGSKYILVDDV